MSKYLLKCTDLVLIGRLSLLLLKFFFLFELLSFELLENGEKFTIQYLTPPRAAGEGYLVKASIDFDGGSSD